MRCALVRQLSAVIRTGGSQIFVAEFALKEGNLLM